MTASSDGRPSAAPFRVICEIRSPTRPSLRRAQRHVSLLAPGCDAILVPDNAIGAPSVSSLFVAYEASLLGASPIAVLNARDRNLLGLQRDLLTAEVTGTREFLFVGGDAHPHGARAELTVEVMLHETRDFAERMGFRRPVIGVASRLGPLPAWKADADAIYLQASFSIEKLLEWRDHVAVSGPLYAGVIVAPSASRARQWNAQLPGVTIPETLIDALDRDPIAGVRHACELIERIEMSHAFDGIHLIPGVRTQEMAHYLERRRQPLAPVII